MPELKREQLAARRLADLHAIASELGIPRFRLLRKPELADAVLTAQAAHGEDVAASRSARKRRRRGGRRRRARQQQHAVAPRS